MLGRATRLNRKNLTRVAIFAVVLLSLEFGALAFMGCTQQARALSSTASVGGPGNVPWRTTIVNDSEPGPPLIVSGTIYAPDGRTPLEGINLFVYQTDATGRYSTTGGDNRNTRIHGLVRTNAEGRYEFRTIKPGSYPGTRNPAHIHAYVSGPNYPEYWIDEYLFEDDLFITPEQRQKLGGKGTFASILSVQRGSDGVLRATRDIKIERCTNNCTGH
ncbi:MAG: protocatechuate 3,4-dioxygenase [Pyrinomonadaceae bacterium]